MRLSTAARSHSNCLNPIHRARGDLGGVPQLIERKALDAAACDPCQSKALRDARRYRHMDPIVETRRGKLRGRLTDGVTAFKGVPYAAPPFGANPLESV